MRSLEDSCSHNTLLFLQVFSSLERNRHYLQCSIQILGQQSGHRQPLRPVPLSIGGATEPLACASSRRFWLYPWFSTGGKQWGPDSAQAMQQQGTVGEEGLGKTCQDTGVTSHSSAHSQSPWVMGPVLSGWERAVLPKQPALGVPCFLPCTALEYL